MEQGRTELGFRVFEDLTGLRQAAVNVFVTGGTGFVGLTWSRRFARG